MAGRTRIAVQAGAANVRVAVATAGAGPQLVAQLPRDGWAGLAATVATWAGRAPAELVLVHPPGAAQEAVAAEVAAAASLAAPVRAVPAPVAAAAGTGTAAVLDAGHSGVEITVLDAAGGRVLDHTRIPGGGALLDAELSAASPGRPDVADLRERLSLLPAAGSLTAEQIAPMLDEVLSVPVAELRRSGVDGPVLLVGGLARTPALAQLVDAAGVRGARVVERPEAAAVLGALQMPSGACQPGAAAAGTWLPPLPDRPPRARRRLGVALATAAAVAALLAVGQLLPRPVTPAGPAAEATGIVQYGYRADLPAGWAHTGGRPERRRTLLTPVAGPQGSDLVAIEASPLGYDAAAEPGRAARELRAVYDAGLADGAVLSDYDPAASFAGRAVTAYRQRNPDGLVVDWYVLFEGDAQLSVGCQHTAAGAAAVAVACATVVAALHRT